MIRRRLLRWRRRSCFSFSSLRFRLFSARNLDHEKNGENGRRSHCKRWILFLRPKMPHEKRRMRQNGKWCKLHFSDLLKKGSSLVIYTIAHTICCLDKNCLTCNVNLAKAHFFTLTSSSYFSLESFKLHKMARR